MTTKTKRFYVTPEGNKYPLFEAPYVFARGRSRVAKQKAHTGGTHD